MDEPIAQQGEALSKQYDATADTNSVDGTSVRNGGAPHICVGSSSKLGALLQFNLDIPSGSQVSAVTLTLHAMNECAASTATPKACQDTTNLSIFRVTSTWNEGARVNTTGSMGGSCGGGSLEATTVSSVGTNSGTATVPPGNGEFTFSDPKMVADVQGWVNNSSTNRGWLIRGGGDLNLKMIASRDHSSSAARPKLSVTYQYGAGQLCSAAADCASGVCNVRCCSGACGACKDCNGSGACVNVARYQDDLACGANQTCNGSGQCRDDNGRTCSGGTTCASGNCADSRCCSTPCTGLCQTCGNASGSCSPIPNGTDPSNECQHTCNGSGGCGNSCAADTDCGSGFYCNGTNCQSQAGGGEACTDTNQCGTGLVCSADNVCCDALCSGDCQSCLNSQNGGLGDGTCGPSPQFSDPVNDCFPGSCSGSASCGANCTTDAQCDAGAWCDAGTCAAKFANGIACTEVRQCQTGLCVDDVCCNAACGGQCEACDNVGSVGSCVASSGSPHGARPQCAGDGSACDGACDGATRGSCALPGGSVQCRAASCSAGQAQLPASCVGSGSCPALATQDCAPYQCGGTGCLNSCTVDTQCQLGFRCDAGACVPARPNGAVCSAGGECASGHCIDGFCCSTACNGQCEACNVAASEGICVAATGAPVGARPACADDGSTCGGVCNGVARSACAYPSSSTSCRAASCDAGEAILAAGCNGAGACPAQQDLSCPSGACDGVLCDGDCAVNADCGVDEYCAAGACVPTRNQGQPCASAAECASGRCADGVCCNSACSGQCEACDVAGSEGNCSPVTGTPKGARPACASDGSACAGSCDGVATAACAYPGSSEVCRAAACSAGIATVEARCSGSGACSSLQQQTCSPYACHPSLPLCDGDCTQDSDCTSPQYCLAGVCANPQGNGAPCSTAGQCGSGSCVDGVCCDGACSGQCQSCTEPGFVGTCSLVSGSPRGGRAACTGTGVCAGSCDGSGTSCAFPGGETSCGLGSCSAGVSVPDAGCNGAGECSAQNAVSCLPFRCAAGGGCGTNCATVADCATGFECVSGACEQPAASGGAGGGAGVGGVGGVGGATGGSGGAATAGVGGASGGSAGMLDAGLAGTGGEGDGLIPAVDEGSTCSVRSAPGGHAPGHWLALGALGLLCLGRRRRSLSRRNTVAQ